MNENNHKGPTPDLIDRLVSAYDTMLERVDEAMHRFEDRGVPALRRSIDQARERAVELGELSREEAERLGQYIQRDMEDAANFLADTGEEIRGWLGFDLRLVESKLLDLVSNVADQTSLQLRELREQARRADLYRTGEVTGPGTLVCTGCGKEMHFHKTGHIPPCPACKTTEFRRAGEENEEEMGESGEETVDSRQ
jgi:predicted RNA-binding Zn-ribbon protein involved in translation (DUF1610 family)